MRELSIYAKRDMARNKADNDAHAERLQAAREAATDAESKLYDELRCGKDHVYITMRIAALIDAKVALALLEL